MSLIQYFGRTTICLPNYIHLYRNKWLKTKPEKMYTKYSKDELDKNDKEFADTEKYFYRIVISDKRPKW